MSGNEIAHLLLPSVGFVTTSDWMLEGLELPAGTFVGVRYRAGLGGVEVWVGAEPRPRAILSGPRHLALLGVRLPTADEERRELSRLAAADASRLPLADTAAGEVTR